MVILYREIPVSWRGGGNTRIGGAEARVYEVRGAEVKEAGLGVRQA